MSGRHRRCFLLEGAPEETRDRAGLLVSALGDDEVRWLERAHEAALELGQSYSAVVVDLHRGFDADLLGRAHGLVVGGGALVLRCPLEPRSRMEARVRRVLGEAFVEPPAPLAPPPPVPAGSEAQTALVESLSRALLEDGSGAYAILADRGRGKSSALGLLAARVRGCVITAADERVTQVARAFAPELAFVPAFELAYGDQHGDPAVVLVDEAAQLPVPLLQQLTQNHPRAKLVFATTTHGYEGTGRGFSLRFLTWLQGERALSRLTLEAPVRWAADDPLEASVHRALLLDAEPAPAARVVDARPETVAHAKLTPDALEDERVLRELFGLLVQAHYRTSPNDLARLLDDEALDPHALLHRGHVVAATLVSREGVLDRETVARLERGERVRGHALAETLVCHSLKPDAGALEMVRSMRIATHPALRRRGLARRLVDEVHAAYDPDLFGTLFGATPALLSFRRAVGYRLVRVGASFGARTGEPTAVMLRPVSARARALTAGLQAELARDLPGLLELLAIEGALRPSPDLDEALRADLPAPAPVDPEEDAARVRAFAFGPLPYEAAAQALERWLPDDLTDDLDDQARALLRARVVERRSWTRIARELYGEDTAKVPALMRALRRSVRRLLS